MKRALTIGQLIANAYPADTRLLFQKYGISVEPTGKTILDAYLVHGTPFLAELVQIASKSVSKFSSIDGVLKLETDKVLAVGAAATAKANAESASSGSWIDKVFNTFTKAGETLSVASGAWETISGIFSGNKAVDTGNATLQTEIYKLQLEAQKEAEASRTKTYLLIGAGVLVAIIAFIMYQKRK